MSKRFKAFEDFEFIGLICYILTFILGVVGFIQKDPETKLLGLGVLLAWCVLTYMRWFSR